MSDDDVVDEGYVLAAEACAQANLTLQQLRALTQAGLLATKKTKRGVLMFCSEDLQRLAGLPRTGGVDEEPSQLIAEMRAMSAGWKELLDNALKQTKQAQEHERLVVTAFTKPLETLTSSNNEQVRLAVDQNKHLAERANAGDKARLDFLVAAEGLLKDRRAEERQDLELNRKHEMRREVWEGVKKAAPHLLEGLRKTTAGGERLAAAERLKENLDPGMLATLIKLKMIPEEQIKDLCIALEIDRAALDKLNEEVDAAEAAQRAEAEAARPTTEVQGEPVPEPEAKAAE